MALPARVSRALLEAPFDTMQREFDTLMNRFFSNREAAEDQGFLVHEPS